ncbi:hypothetical protein [Clostridium sp. UBA1056]|uniref:hypothetical protein n=1 Tax=unclassified Clostridium TaxID=2614128 RepID=UPI003216C147
MLKEGIILSTKEVVEKWGTDKQKQSYAKSGKLAKNIKEAILREANTECVLETFKEGREVKYKVVEVLDNKIEKVDNRGGSKPLLREELTIQLLNALYEADSNVVTASFVTVAEMLNMINEDWKVGRNNIPEASKYLEIEESIMYDFFSRTKDGFKYHIEASLDYLKKKALITWDKDSYKICKWETSIICNKLGEPVIENGKIKYKIVKVICDASEGEIEFLLDVRNRVLDSRTYNQYFAEFGRNKFYDECNKIIRKESNILYYIPLYTIRLTRAGIKREIDRIELDYAIESANTKAIKASMKYGDTIAKTDEGFKEIDEVIKNKTNQLTRCFIDKDGVIGLDRILIDIKAKNVA